MRKKAIIFFGAPGSGKGTQANLLEKEYKVNLYSMSDKIREFSKKKGENKKVIDKINNGILLSDLDIFDIFFKTFKSKKRILLEGLPRTKNQAIWLYGFLKYKGYDIIFLYFNVKKKELLKRILNRKKLEKRKDDNEKIFNKRYENFLNCKKQTMKIFKKKIFNVDANKNPEIISNNVFKIVDKFFKKY